MTVLVLVVVLALQSGELESEPLKVEVAREVKALAGGEPGRAVLAEGRLLALGPAAVEPLLEVSLEATRVELQAIRELLPQFGPSAVRELALAPGRIALNRETRVALQEEAASAVARMGDASDAAVRDLVDSQPAGRQASSTSILSEAQGFALRVLRRRGTRGIPDLVGLLDHPSSAVRSASAELLANIADPLAADGLLGALSSPDAGVRAPAARALGRIGDERAANGLLRLLQDPNFVVRQSAAAALGRIYERRFVGDLAGLARDDPEVSVRRAAAVALAGAHDSLGRRLGRRYMPTGTGGFADFAIRLSSTIRLLLTGAILYGLIAVAGRWRTESRWMGVLVGAWLTVLTTAGLGFFWARLWPGTTGAAERALLCLVVPVTACLAYMAPGVKGLRLISLGVGLLVMIVVLIPSVGIMGGLLLFAVAPWITGGFALAAVAVVWWRSRRSPDGPASLASRQAAVGGALGLYLGYGVGWLALWGYIGG